MTGPDTTSYALTVDQAEALRDAALLPADLRRKVLAKYLKQHGPLALLSMFVEFIGAANSIAENCQTWLGDFLIAEGVNADPYIHEKVNSPCIAGAMHGVILSSKVDAAKACGGCAYRLGSIANQCLVTTTDAEYVVGDCDFMCHEHLDAKGEPTRKCVGHALRMKAGHD